MRIARTSLALLIASGTLTFPGHSQQRDSGQVTLERLFGTQDFAPEPFGPARWLADGTAYTTIEPSREQPGGSDIVRYDAATGRRNVLVSAHRLVPAGDSLPLDVEDYAWSSDARLLLIFTNSKRVWRQNTRGDYWVLELSSGRLRRLGGNAAPSTLMFATFSPDGDRVAYVREHNLYVESIKDGRIIQLTRDGSKTIINGTFDWVYEEELSLRNGFRWSPDGRRIAYWQLDASGVRNFDLINDTDSLYSFVVPVQYPKAGTPNSAARIGVVNADGGPTRWLELEGDPRNHYIARMDWAGGSDTVVLQRLDRPQHTDEVILGDAGTGRVRGVLTEHDSTWVDVVDDVRWLDHGRRFTWVSERDGWRHLYAVSRTGSSLRLLTPGQFDLTNPASPFGEPLVLGTDAAGKWIYYTASPDNPTQLYLFRSRIDGHGGPTRVTPQGQSGTHLYQIAPGARWALHTYGAFGTPPVTDLIRLPGHQVVRTVRSNQRQCAAVRALRRGPMEFFRVDGGDGQQLDAWMMKPPDFDPTHRYPVLFYVYGEPAGQTVLDDWDGLTYLWHLMLTQQGYIVASVDNRGTPAPRGRAWRRAIYRQIGILASAEQAAAARAIAQRPYVDSTRIGVWGWSGGGSMTLNLLFRSPELYRVGMSVAPVTDERYYDTIYQERYMGLPQENPDGYRLGSPITFADRLRGDLLLVHGSGDDNVHYQNSERLVNALVAAGKPFSLMVYPNRSHCICEGTGTAPHLYGLLTRYLRQHLPAGPAQQAGGVDPTSNGR
jgi:dipeptidyl-peptidase 4